MSTKTRKRKPTQLDRIEQMLLEMKHPVKVMDIDRDERNEPETFKVGDWVVSDRHYTCILQCGVPYRVKSLIGSSLVFDIGEFTNRQYGRDSFRRATQEEIDAHLKAEEDRKPIDFGAKVRFDDFGPFSDPPCEYAFYMGKIGDKHQVVYKHDNDPTRLCTYRCQRSEFTVVNP